MAQTSKSLAFAATRCRELEQLLVPDFFRALADANRLGILGRLASSSEGESVGSIAQCCPVDLSVVSRHLGTLRQAGIVGCEKRGKQVIYRVRTRWLAETLRGMADAIEACCPGEDATCTLPVSAGAGATGSDEAGGKEGTPAGSDTHEINQQERTPRGVAPKE